MVQVVCIHNERFWSQTSKQITKGHRRDPALMNINVDDLGLNKEEKQQQQESELGNLKQRHPLTKLEGYQAEYEMVWVYYEPEADDQNRMFFPKL